MCGCNKRERKKPELKQPRMPSLKMSKKPKPTTRPGGKKLPKI